MFEIYIPKWRVPEPIPEVIKVSLYFPPHLPELKNILTSEMTKSNPNLCKLPILSQIKWYSDHTKTVRYNPIGLPDTWEIGSPYIPVSILPQNHIEILVIQIQWTEK